MTVRELIEELQKCDGDMTVLGADYRGPYEVDEVWSGSISKGHPGMPRPEMYVDDWNESTWKRDDYSGTHKVVYLR
jgi:hypothetical protein